MCRVADPREPRVKDCAACSLLPTPRYSGSSIVYYVIITVLKAQYACWLTPSFS